MSIASTQDATNRRNSFLRIVFHGLDGYVCIARINRSTKEFFERFFRVPHQFEELFDTLLEWANDYDIYFCPMLFKRPIQRKKEDVDDCHMIWADLDECHPDLLLVPPSIVIQTSPDRYQALWRLANRVEPVVAEALSRRIAYKHQLDGADLSGWDLTQLLRVPFTTNHKYPELYTVHVISTNQRLYTPEDFAEDYPEVEAPPDKPIPQDADLPYGGDARKILEDYRMRLQPYAYILFDQDPPRGASWSELMWKLDMLCFEAGMSSDEVFAVARDAKCNKFRRDGRAAIYLWRDVLRAYNKYEMSHKTVPDAVLDKPLLSQAEREAVLANPGIVEEYIEWAKTLGDAAWEYHQAAAFVCLSSLLAGPVRLPTSFGTMVPNLWFMILADTTLTRKTTAMDIGMDLITEIDSDSILATDGSIEGLFSSLSTRPGRPSIFLRDEFSGLLEMIGKKDYYAGMAETFTKMYDGKYQKRVLRREVIEVKEPVLIMFAGGIKDRILHLLTHEHIASGFLPRFIFVSAESDAGKLRPLGPPTDEAIEGRYILLKKFADLHAHYTGLQTITVNGRATSSPKRFDASLTPEAWERYNVFEQEMLNAGLSSAHKDIVTPTFDRLAKSGLKLAILLSAARRLEGRVVVELQDILKAISYIEQWRPFSAMVINSVGQTANEKQMERVLRYIQEKPGILRSEVMQLFRLTARDAETIFLTLDQRGQLNRIRSGRTERLYVIA